MTPPEPIRSAGPFPLGRPLLAVVGADGEQAPWQSLVDLLGRIVGSQPAVAVVPRAPDGVARVAAVLRRAADAPGPVLVVPPPLPPDGPESAVPLQRVLAPFDTSDEVTACSRPLLRLMQAEGVEVVQFHVLTIATMPPMWEGSGHHAAAWRTELRRRHRVGGAAVEVLVGGPPGPAVAARSTGADLVVLCWNRSAEDGRAGTVRQVMAGTAVPVLLLPMR